MPKTYSIVGSQFTGISENELMKIEVGSPALLVREPTNQFDPRAIAVYVDGRRIGYIPKKQNQVLAQFIDQSGVTQTLAMDSKEHRTLPAKFIRSPNSNFPMVEVE